MALSQTGRIVSVLGGRKTLKRNIANLHELNDRVQAGLPYAAFQALIVALGLTRVEVAAALGLPERTLARRRSEKKLSAAESDKVLRLARIAAHAAEVLGGEARAGHWLRGSIVALGSRRPLDLLATDIGAHEVDTILGRIEHGVIS